MTGRRKTLHIACAVGAVALLAVVHFGLVRPGLRNNRMARNESSAMAFLRAYLAAQQTFSEEDRYGIGKLVFANPKDGTGFQDLYRIGGPDGSGKELRLIDLEFARATSPETPKDGYWFVHIGSDDGAASNRDDTGDCSLCAVPAVYGETGTLTFVVDLTGTVYKLKTGGKPLTSRTQLEGACFWKLRE